VIDVANDLVAPKEPHPSRFAAISSDTSSLVLAVMIGASFACLCGVVHHHSSGVTLHWKRPISVRFETGSRRSPKTSSRGMPTLLSLSLVFHSSFSPRTTVVCASPFICRRSFVPRSHPKRVSPPSPGPSSFSFRANNLHPLQLRSLQLLCDFRDEDPVERCAPVAAVAPSVFGCLPLNEYGTWRESLAPS
jgi:hypothetical protein